MILSNIKILILSTFFLLPIPASTYPTNTTTTVTTGISSPLLSRLTLYSQFCSAIYCPTNYLNTTFHPLTCPTTPSSCPLVESTQAYLYAPFSSIGTYSITGMIAIDPTHSSIILVFEGANTVSFAAKLLSSLIPCPAICEECRCHEGYYTAWMQTRTLITSFMHAALTTYSGYEFVVTGHSLGSVLAVYAAAEFRNNGTAAALYTYGQPHAGDINLAIHLQEQERNWRVTHANDAAPQYGSVEAGYAHFSPEYWIYEDRNEAFTVVEDQVKVVRGINSREGNLGTDGLGESAHFEYFQRQMAACFTTVEPGLQFTGPPN